MAFVELMNNGNEPPALQIWNLLMKKRKSLNSGLMGLSLCKKYECKRLYFGNILNLAL